MNGEEVTGDRRAALAAEWAKWAREEARGWENLEELSERHERLDALLIRSRGAGLSYGEIAEMQSRALTEAKGEDVPIAPEELMAYMRDHVDDVLFSLIVSTLYCAGPGRCCR